MTIFPRVLRTPGGLIGFVGLLLLLATAFLGPLVSPNSPYAVVGLSATTPSAGHPLGTDFLGRDVLARALNGGMTVIGIGLTATVVAYLIGILLGVYAGYAGGLGDSIVMRAADVMLAFPPLLLLLLLVGALGQQTWVLMVGVVVAHIPGIARLTRTTAMSVARMPYVEAAQTRGDSTAVIVARDLVPNIAGSLLADFGIRFSVSIIMVASLNYLGLGLAPPAADWGLMTAENQQIITLNPLAVLAPAALLALLAISINLLADAYLRVTGTTRGRGPRRRRPAAREADPALATASAADRHAERTPS